MQGLWIEASRGIAELADAMQDAALGAARTGADRAKRAQATRADVLAGGSRLLRVRHRAARTRSVGRRARARAGSAAEARLDALRGARPRRRGHGAARGAAVVADARRRSARSRRSTTWAARRWPPTGARGCCRPRAQLYDPLSYHYGSVWPLFTGWASMARVPLRPPARRLPGADGERAADVQGALGYVTELLSGDFNAPFGRSSHHQVWSEAMVVTPVRARAARHRGGRRRPRADVSRRSCPRTGTASLWSTLPPA